MLSMNVSDDHSDWDTALPFVTFAYNSSYHEMAGYSLFYLLFGHDPLLSFGTMLLRNLASTTSYAHDAITRVAITCTVARDWLSSSQVEQKSLYDHQHRDACFPWGSLILLWLHLIVLAFARSSCRAMLRPIESCAK